MGKLSEEDWRALDGELRAQAIEILKRWTSSTGSRTRLTSAAWIRLEALLSGFQIFLAVMVILLILLHSGKDAGPVRRVRRRSGGGPFGGGSLVERNLDRWTIFFCVLFVANVIVLLKIA